MKEINLDSSPQSIQYAMSMYPYQYSEFFRFDMLTELIQFEWAWDAYPEPRGTQNYLGNAMTNVAKVSL